MIKPKISVFELYRLPEDTLIGDTILDPVVEILRKKPVHFAGDVAKLLGVRYRDLSGAVRLLTGQTLDQLIKEWRMMQAVELINRTELDFLTIANRCGFTTVEHLSAALQKKMQKTPYELRNGCHRNDIRRHRCRMTKLAAQTPQVVPDSVPAEN